MKEGMVDQRRAIRFCNQEGELLSIAKEVDPIYEIAAITKSLDGGPALIFEKIKDYPKWQVVTNLFSRRERVAKYFGTKREDLSKRILEAVKNPVPPKLVNQAPCQENVISQEIDILKFLPVIKQTKIDIGPVISGGVLTVVAHNRQHAKFHLRKDTGLPLVHAHRFSRPRGYIVPLFTGNSAGIAADAAAQIDKKTILAHFSLP